MIHANALFSDYHIHPQVHSLRPYSQELLQPWADHARQIGLRDIALTDHDRYHAASISTKSKSCAPRIPI